MENYRPAGPPIWKKFLLNPLLHVSVIFVLVFGGVLYIQKRQKEQMLARVEFLSGGPLVIEKGSQSSEISADATTEPITESTPIQPPPTPAQPSTTSPPVTTSAALATQNLSKKDTSAIGSVKLKITFAEVDNDTLKKWIPEIQKSGQFMELGDSNFGTIANSDQKMSLDKVTSFQSLEKTFDSSHKSQTFFSGVKSTEDDNDFGVGGLVSIVKSDDGRFHAEVEVMRSPHFSEGPDKAPRVINTGELNINGKTAILIWGFLPHKPPFDLQEMPSDGVLKIYNSPQFKSGKSEFTLILEFDTPLAQ